MRVIQGHADVPAELRGAVVAVGNFDGVHRGHLAVIGEARRIAAEQRAPSAVVTFDPHPRRYFKPNDPPFELTPLPSKARQIAALGIDALFVLPFDPAMAALTAHDFVAKPLVGGIQIRHVVVGFDFVFGNNRRGNVELLEGMSEEFGFGFTAVQPVQTAGAVCSSTTIRHLLRDGKPREAAAQLGRLWEIEGEVQTGDRRGRTIGFPTANIALGPFVTPAIGVYAVWVGIGSRWHMGAANIGSRPTVGGTDVRVEANVFDFSGDLYGQIIRVALVDYLRPEMKFSGLDELKARIAEDSKKARAVLEAAPRLATVA